MNTEKAIEFIKTIVNGIGKLALFSTDEQMKPIKEGAKQVIELLKRGEKYKEIIVDQSLKIKELEEAIKIQDNLIKEYMTMLNKYEGQGLLMDAVGRKLLLNVVEKED